MELGIVKLIVKFVIKATSLVLAAWLTFALVASTAPYVSTKKMDAGTKQALAQTQFYGDGAPGPDRALVIEAPADALNVRLVAVRAATETLDIANHLIKDSQSSRAFLGEVLAAADRGVQVRLVVDGMARLVGGAARDQLKALDAHPNVECRLYNPVELLKPWRWHALLHDKFIIVDGELLLLGGRNVDERHFGPSGFARPITHDRDVLIWQAGAEKPDEPAACAQATAYMDLLWDYELTRPIAKKPMPADRALRHRDTLQRAAVDFEASDPLFYAKPLQHYLDGTVETACVTLLHNPVDAAAKEPWVAWQLARLALAAEDRVVLQTPYATGNKDLLATMAGVAENAELVMITNSPASTPNLPAFSNYYGQRRKFLDAGAQIFEYQRADSIHGKSLVIDGRLSAVGSLNMDDRSFYLDTETMLVIDSPQFAAQLGGVMADIQGQSLQVGPDNAYMPCGGVQALKAPPLKRAVMRVVYVLMRPFQFLL